MSLDDPVIITCSISGAPAGRDQCPVIPYPPAEARRTVLEDNLSLPGGTMERSNAELVAEARQMTLDIGRRPATVAEDSPLRPRPARSLPSRSRF